MMLWMEEKGRVLVDEPSREPSNIMRKLRRHEAATCELAATQGHVEGLQQVRDAGTRVRGLLGFMFPLQEEWISLSRALASPSFLFHSAGNPGLSTQTSPESFSRPFPSSLRGSPLACRLCLDTVLLPAVQCLLTPHYFQASEESPPASAHRSGATRTAGGALVACGVQLATSHSHCCPRTQPTTATPSTSSSTRHPRPLCPLQVGRELLSSRPHAQEDVQARLQGLSSKWEELRCKMAERGKQLQQTRQQDQLLRLLQVGPREGRIQEGA